MRRQLWEENVINIDNHNAEFLDGKHTYKQAENFFTDMVIILIDYSYQNDTLVRSFLNHGLSNST